jgi:hypothetical protein
MLSEGELYERKVAGGAELSIDGSGGYLFLRVAVRGAAVLASLGPDDVEWLAGVVEAKRLTAEGGEFKGSIIAGEQ